MHKTWSFANYASPQKYTFSASHVMPTSTSPVWGTNHSFTDEFKDHTIVEEKTCVFEMSWVFGTHWSYNIHFIRISGVKDQEHSGRSREAVACSWTNLSMHRVWRWSYNGANRAGLRGSNDRDKSACRRMALRNGVYHRKCQNWGVGNEKRFEWKPTKQN